jgi:NDP-sugar pyrophosphorylase family protein
MNNETTLVIMAAGMGSRFGGLKQMAPLGPNGEVIIDYSVFDAVRAGFDRAVIIIKKEIEHDFREMAGKRIEKHIDVEYAFQEVDKIPSPFVVPDGRTKPWGTGHAILCAKDKIHTPFAVINSDDYYGVSSYKLIHDQLISDEKLCMVGFELGKTLSESGTVSRGVCEVENGYLKSVTEHFSLDKNSGIPLNTTVSMNLWGLDLHFFDKLERDFYAFLSEKHENPLKSEFCLPFVVDDMIKNEGAKFRVLKSEEKWYGVTYKEDADDVKRAILDLTNKGVYYGI